MELLEDFLRDAPRPEPAERVRRLRRRLQASLRAAEFCAGALGGVALVLVAQVSLLPAIGAIVAYMFLWRFLGAVAGVCNDVDPRPWTSTLDKAKSTVGMALAISWIALGVLALTGTPHAVPAALAAAATSLAAAVNGRGLAQALVMRSKDIRQRTLIIGSGAVAAQVVERLSFAPHLALDVIGLVDDDVHVDVSPDLPRLGGLSELDEILDRHDVDRVIVAFSRSGHDDLLRSIRTCWDRRVAIDIVPRLFEFLDGARAMDQVGGLPMMSITLPQLSRSAAAIKRASDIVLSALGLLATLPVLLVVAVAIKLTSPGPVFFRQMRVGRDHKTFRIYKFRTMYVDADERKHEYMQYNDATDGVMFKIHDDPRITRIGRFLRKSSIDEIPQLINVLRGEMSLVGPRPLIAEETAAFNETWHERRLDLRPGLTGPWQIYGRSNLPFQDMLRFDYQYVAGWSLGRDIRIVLSTIPVLYSGRGAY